MNIHKAVDLANAIRNRDGLHKRLQAFRAVFEDVEKDFLGSIRECENLIMVLERGLAYETGRSAATESPVDCPRDEKAGF